MNTEKVYTSISLPLSVSSISLPSGLPPFPAVADGTQSMSCATELHPQPLGNSECRRTGLKETTAKAGSGDHQNETLIEETSLRGDQRLIENHN